MKPPVIIFAVGLILCIAASMLTGIVRVPAIAEHDFPYSVTYTLDGETHVFEGIYRCRFISTGRGTDPLERYYEGSYLKFTSEYHPAAYTIARKDGLELCIVSTFSNHYLMGDAKGEPESTLLYDPYLAVMDEEGVEYEDAETLGKFDAALLSWELPEPVDNSFRFAGFSLLHDSSMLAMLIVGILVILACVIFVKRDKSVSYKTLDKISVVLSFFIALAVIPFITVIVLMMQIAVSGNEAAYQRMLCLPAFTAFTVAASIALRRNRFTKTGFFLQLAAPLLFVLFMLI